MSRGTHVATAVRVLFRQALLRVWFRQALLRAWFRQSLLRITVVCIAGFTWSAHADSVPHYVGEPAQPTPSTPREDAAISFAVGHLDEALTFYQLAIARDRNDRIALRDGGRVAFALGKHAVAAALLDRADALITAPDAELLYLLGEAQWTLGRSDEARATHQRALAILGLAPKQRSEKLWAARIRSRLGDRAAADTIYAALTAVDPADAEVALARAEMHAAARDWPAAERAVRGLIAHAPHNKRANEMLAWVYEARGNLTDELATRKQLSGPDATAGDIRDYGRALERAGDWTAALATYRRAAKLPDGEHDLELARALERVEHRMSPEVAAGAIGRSDPSSTGLGAFVGAALPFGHASHAAVIASYELATSGSRNVQSIELSAAVVTRRANVTAILGAKAGIVDAGNDAITMNTRSVFAPGAFASAGSGLLLDHVTLAADVEAGGLWRETPRAVFEAGRSYSAAGHVYVSALRQRLVIDSGALVRQLRLIADDQDVPRASQLLAWTGADLRVWSNFASQARGEILDDQLQRATFSADSAVVSYRHYESFGDTDPMFAARLALAERASIDELSVTLRKVLARGAFALEARGGFGRDWARELWLERAAVAIWFSPTSASRVSLALEIARESVAALVGERRLGVVNYHADL
jgi:tetratricopeptide (TPR) repeat protein